MMMATRLVPPNPPAAPRSKRSTRKSSSRAATRRAVSPSRLSRRLGSASRPSADLAGQAVALSIDVPAAFDAPLAPHHKLVGRWAAAQDDAAELYTRHGARRRIEQLFDTAVTKILSPFGLVDLQVVVLAGDAELPPALAMICGSMGQLDLGWIEKSNLLSDTAFGNVAPVGWRAAAYRALEETLGTALPIFGYADLFEEVAAYYWDGETEDAKAREALIDYFGHDPDDVAGMTLPSEMNARRPEWMTAKPAPLKHMPPPLRQALRRLRTAHAALEAVGPTGNAWHVERENLSDYIPKFEDCSHLPPITIVPFDQFATEIDDVARFGMEQGFDDLAGFCPLIEAGQVDAWFASLKVGTEFLLAAQHLIDLDPANPVKP